MRLVVELTRWFGVAFSLLHTANDVDGEHVLYVSVWAYRGWVQLSVGRSALEIECGRPWWRQQVWRGAGWRARGVV